MLLKRIGKGENHGIMRSDNGESRRWNFRVRDKVQGQRVFALGTESRPGSREPTSLRRTRRQVAGVRMYSVTYRKQLSN